jgi:NADH-quinone oxidoreductase subunit E
MSYAPAPETLKRIEEAVRRYPEKQAALLPVLHLLQRESGFISPEIEQWAAGFLGIEPIRVREVVSFYSLLRRAPAGKYVIQVCRNLSCTLAGSDDLLARLKERLGISPGETTSDGRFTLLVTECLGNCDHAPCLMVNDEEHGPVTGERLDDILKGLD